MRFLIRARIPTEAGNKMVQDPNFLKKLEEYINKVKAEATYFFEADGNRVAAFIVDIQNANHVCMYVTPSHLFSATERLKLYSLYLGTIQADPYTYQKKLTVYG